jgi:predicted aspartyl protease
MGRITTPVTIRNAMDPSKSMECDALVDTGASHLTLPSAWRERLGDLELARTVELETATQEVVEGEICGPVRVELEGFPPISTEVLFVDMTPADGRYEPLVGWSNRKRRST